MNTTNALLDRVREVKGLTSDYQLAKLLDTTPQNVSNWRNQRNGMDNTTAMMVAEHLRANPLEILAKLQMEKKLSNRSEKVWSKYLPRTLLAPLITGVILHSGELKATDTEADQCKEELKNKAAKELYEKGKGKHAVIENGKIRYLTDAEWEAERVNKTPVIRIDTSKQGENSKSEYTLCELYKMLKNSLYTLFSGGFVGCSAPRGA